MKKIMQYVVLAVFTLAGALAGGVLFENYTQDVVEVWHALEAFELALFSLMALVALVSFGVWFWQELKKQHHAEQPSYVWYMFWFFVWVPVVIMGVHALFYANSVHEMFPVYVLVFCLWYTTCFVFGCAEPKTFSWNTAHFCPESSGEIKDGFGFQKTAKLYKEVIKKEEKRTVMLVAEVRGGVGEGKSSFARMLVEAFEAENTLYMYLSLTEVNHAEDFSVLFEKRWRAMFAERYPLLPFGAHHTLANIFRDVPHGAWLGTLFSFLPHFSFANTKAKVWEKETSQKSEYVSSDVATMFCNIPEVKEDRIIVLIDEVERGVSEEVYRVVETIERFKNELRLGAPCPVVFLVCVDREKLFENLEKTENFCSYNFPAKTFFELRKSFNYLFPLPTKTTEDKKQYIKKFLQDIKENFSPSSLAEIYINDLGKEFFTERPIEPFEEDRNKRMHAYIPSGDRHIQVLEYVLFLLSKESLRLIQRIFRSLFFYLETYQSVNGDIAKPELFRISDHILLEYVRLEMPHLYTFFGNTAENFTSGREGVGYAEFYGSRGKSIRGEIDTIRKKAGEKNLTDKEWVDYFVIIQTVARFYLYAKEMQVSKMPLLEFTSSTPENLWRFLSYQETGDTDVYRQYIHAQIEGRNEFLKTIENERLYSYNQFLTSQAKDEILPAHVHADLAQEFLRRVEEGVLVETPLNDESFLYKNTRQFGYRIGAVINGESFEEAKTLLDSFLRSEKVPTSMKFLIISNFFHKYNELEDAIRYVFDEYHMRYEKEKRSSYVHEGHLRYFLYQGWTGKRDDVMRVRSIAQNGLDTQEALLYYWKQLVYASAWEKNKDLVWRDGTLLFHKDTLVSLTRFVPLTTLLAKTEAFGVETLFGEDAEGKKKYVFWKALYTRYEKDPATVPDAVRKLFSDKIEDVDEALDTLAGELEERAEDVKPKILALGEGK